MKKSHKKPLFSSCQRVTTPMERIHKRWLVVAHYQDGKYPAQICRRTGFNKMFVKRTIERFEETGTVDDRPQSGRPRVDLNPDKVVKCLKRKRTGSIRKAVKKLKTNDGHPVSRMTVWRVAQEAGMKFRIRPKKPLLTRAHIAARLAFAQTPRPIDFWDTVLWTDEASFALYSDVRGQWTEPGEQPEPRRTKKWPARIRIWAGISKLGKTKLIRIAKTQNSAEYVKMLKKKGLPAARNIFGDSNWVFMQDGDGAHTAKSTRAFLRHEGISLLEPWPAHSPDLNPIENAWGIVEQSLQLVNPNTERGLWKSMKRAWKEIDETKLCNLCGSLPRRIQSVIDNAGQSIKYYYFDISY